VSDAFETWAAGVIYNNQPLPERKGIPYFLAEKAHAAGVREGIRQAREAVAAEQALHETFLANGEGDFRWEQGAISASGAILRAIDAL
jgi:hypothetical protein